MGITVLEKKRGIVSISILSLTKLNIEINQIKAKHTAMLIVTPLKVSTLGSNIDQTPANNTQITTNI
jgi:hypothetical protein